jgi:hypothetical protein
MIPVTGEIDGRVKKLRTDKKIDVIGENIPIYQEF